MINILPESSGFVFCIKVSGKLTDAEYKVKYSVPGSRGMLSANTPPPGTATFDGLAIAWATLDFLAKNNNCRTIFATHFHELTKLTEELRNIKNMAMQISEDNGEIIFLHEIKEGVVDKSYGIQVAKLAGLPNEVTKKAEVILKTLESEESFSDKDLPLFKNDYQEIQDIELMKIKEEIGNININKITPIDALNLLNNIKSLIEKKNK